MSLVGVRKLTTLSFSPFILQQYTPLPLFSHQSTQMNCCDSTSNNKYQPRQRRMGPYVKVNSYTQPPSKEQIITAILFAIQLVGHSVFIVPVLPPINHTILWTMLGFHYVLLIIVGHDYIYLTTKDPVDRMILNGELAVKYSSVLVKHCLICNCQVHKNSHHCMRCNRCTEQFDHHCRYLNNCIGSRNYQVFFRMLLIYTLYNLNVIGMAIWAAVDVFHNPNDSFANTAWGIVTVAVLTLLIESAVAALLGFHCYISCQNMTTFQHTYQPKNMNDVIEKININLFQAPVSSERLRRQQVKALH